MSKIQCPKSGQAGTEQALAAISPLPVLFREFEKVMKGNALSTDVNAYAKQIDEVER